MYYLRIYLMKLRKTENSTRIISLHAEIQTQNAMHGTKMELRKLMNFTGFDVIRRS
jgi:hypothetical protein